MGTIDIQQTVRAARLDERFDCLKSKVDSNEARTYEQCISLSDNLDLFKISEKRNK